MNATKKQMFLVNFTMNEVCAAPKEINTTALYDWYPIAIDDEQQLAGEVMACNFRDMNRVEFDAIPELRERQRPAMPKHHINICRVLLDTMHLCRKLALI